MDMEKRDLIDKIKEIIVEVQEKGNSFPEENINNNDFFNNIISLIDNFVEKVEENNNSDTMFFLKHIYDYLLVLMKYPVHNNSILNAEMEEIKKNYIKSLEYFLNAVIEKKESENIQEETKEIISVGSKKPTKAISPIDKVSNTVFGKSITCNGEDIQILIDSEEKITTLLSVDLEKPNNKNIEISGDINEYDRAVFEAVLANWAEGNRIITIQMIMNAMAGGRRLRNVTDTQKSKINNSLTKLRAAQMKLNIAQEKAYYKGLEDFPDVMEDSVLVSKYTEGKKYMVNGQMVGNEGAIIMPDTPPILYYYAEAKKQILINDIEMLNLPVNFTETNILLQNELNRRIGRMESKIKRKKTNSKGWNVIRFEYIFEKLEIPRQSAQKSRIIKTTEKILDDWKMKKRIKDFEMIKEKRTVKKVKILFKKNGKN